MWLVIGVGIVVQHTHLTTRRVQTQDAVKPNLTSREESASSMRDRKELNTGTDMWLVIGIGVIVQHMHLISRRAWVQVAEKTVHRPALPALHTPHIPSTNGLKTSYSLHRLILIPRPQTAHMASSNFASRIAITREERKLSYDGKRHAIMSCTSDLMRGGQSFYFVAETLHPKTGGQPFWSAGKQTSTGVWASCAHEGDIEAALCQVRWARPCRSHTS